MNKCGRDFTLSNYTETYNTDVQGNQEEKAVVMGVGYRHEGLMPATEARFHFSESFYLAHWYGEIEL